MRYYIYLDKPFLRTLFAILDESSFNIDVVEYAVRKSYTNNNELSLAPTLEIAQSNHDVLLLNAFIQFFGCGYLKPKYDI